MSTALALILSAIASAAQPSRLPPAPPPSSLQTTARATRALALDPPRLSSGYRSRQISLRHRATDANAADTDGALAIAEKPHR
jgi:hypothetical protein